MYQLPSPKRIVVLAAGTTAATGAVLTTASTAGAPAPAALGITIGAFTALAAGAIRLVLHPDDRHGSSA